MPRSRKNKHKIEAAAMSAAFSLFRALPLDAASRFGGFLARVIGCFMKANKTAEKNLKMVFPEKTAAERKEILRGMWDNLGRTAAELAHLGSSEILPRITIIGAENLPERGKPAFMFSGHIGNWELLACAAQAHGRPITAVYREANNKLADAIIAKIRAARCFNLIPKGRQGAVKIARAIKNNEAIAMLVDQKMNDGILLPFFGRGAMTAPAIAELALRYGAPIIPARVVRRNGANFEVFVYPPLPYQKTGDSAKDAEILMTKVNQILEGWIREHPEQWFWVHKRWPILV
jgi:KDO2-lipid IV(A) lauroyltransferase